MTAYYIENIGSSSRWAGPYRTATEAQEWAAKLVAAGFIQRATVRTVALTEEEWETEQGVIQTCPCGDPNCPNPGDCDAMAQSEMDEEEG